MKFWRMIDLGYALVSGDHERAVAGNAHFYVDQVQIWGEPPPGSSMFHIRDLRDQTDYLARRVPHVGSPVLLRLKLTPFQRHEPENSESKYITKALLVSAVVSTPDGQREMGRTEITLQQAVPKKGVKGAKAPQELDLDRQRAYDAEIAREVLERIYGTKDWDRFMHPN